MKAILKLVLLAALAAVHGLGGAQGTMDGTAVDDATKPVAPVVANSAPRGIIDAQVLPVTPDEADQALNLRAMPGNATEGVSAAAAALQAGPAVVTDSIPELARALKGDVDLIYEYVRNSVEYYPVFGTQKGALGALIDRQGTAFDQAALMVALLRQSGYRANYVRGRITLTGAQVRDWLGIDVTRACAVVKLLTYGGIPHTFSSTDATTPCPANNGSLVRATLTHVWVQVYIGGTAYYFDPSFKPHTRKAALNLAAITGYNPATYLGDAKSGATLGADFVQNINRAKVHQNLTSYATTLATWLRTNKPAAQLDDVIGGKSIVAHDGSIKLRQLQLPHMTPNAEQTVWTEIPDNLKPALTVSYAGILWKRTSDALYGRRLTITYNASNQPELRLDGVLQATGSALTRGTMGDISFTVTHPYIFSDDDANKPIPQKIRAGGTYFISNGWGPVSRGLVERMRGALDAARAQGQADTSEAVVGASLGVLAATWMAQSNEATLMTGRLGRTSVVMHRQVGVAGHDGDGPYVDLPGNIYSFVSEDAIDARERATFFSAATRGSIFESTVVQQVAGVNAVSTVRLIDLALASGDKVFDMRAGNFDALRTVLAATCASSLEKFRLRVQQGGARLILPARCNLRQQGWSGAGYFDIATAAVPVSIGAVIGGGYAGGFASVKQPPATTVGNTSLLAVSDAWLKKFTGRSFGDPIDMLTGAFLYARNDITTGLGELPHGLELNRLYSSAGNTTPGPLGRGWTHSLAASVAVGSDGFQGLGEDSALDAVAALVEQMVALDLYADAAKPLDKIVVATVGQAWLGAELVDNTVIVRQGLNGEVFVRLPDRSLNAPPGNPARLERNPADKTYTYETLHKSQLKFNAAGRIESLTHPSGVQARFTYSGNDLTQVQNSFGRTLTVTNEAGRIKSVGDGTRSVSYGYDARGNLATFTDANGQVTRFAYDSANRLTQVFYPSKPSVAALTNVYDSLGRVQTQTNANGKVYTYYFAGSRSEERDPLNASKVSYYDSRGNVIKSTDARGRHTLNDYDGHNRLTRTTLPEGNRVEYIYDDAPCKERQLRCTHNVKQVSQVAKPGSGMTTLVSTYAYGEAFNKVIWVKDPRGNVTDYSYYLGMPKEVKAPKDATNTQPVTTYGYTSFTGVAGFPQFALPTSVTRNITASTSVTTTTAYNAGNRFVPQSTTVDSGGLRLTTLFTYDAVGNLTQVNGPRTDVTDVTDYGYDKERRQTSITNALKEQTLLAYDADGRLVRTARSRAPDFPNTWLVSCGTYTNSGKPLLAWGPGVTAASTACPATTAPTPVVSHEYDDLDRPRRVTQSLTTAEGGNRVTETDYFPDDTVAAVRRAVGSAVAQTTARYTYTPNGLPETLTDARGLRTTYEYDGHGRLRKLRFPDKAAVNVSSATDYEEYGYDAVGNLTSLRKRDGQSVTLAYDSLNRLLSRSYAVATHNVSFGYDLLGRRTAANKGDGHAISYAWDNAGRLLSTTAGGRTLSFAYDAAGNRTRLTWPNSLFVTTTYDALNRPTSILEQGTTRLASYAYYPQSLRRTVSLGNSTTTSYEYNNQGDLASLSHNVVNPTGDVTYTYKRNQAREITGTTWNNDGYFWRPAALGTTSYSVNGLNQYTAVATARPTYTANGNLAGDGVWTYGYDTDNQLVSATRSGYAATLAYDAEGRMRQTVLAGVATQLLYDGTDLVAEYDAGGTLLRRYVHGPGVDEPLVVYEGAGAATKSWLYADHLGSIVAQANAAGTTTALYSYGPFGEPNVATGVRLRYTGQQYVAALGLYHYKARFYSPTLGRFLQTDPVGTVDDTNLYAYVGNNPVNLADPTGLLAAEAKMLGGRLGDFVSDTAIAAHDRASVGWEFLNKSHLEFDHYGGTLPGFFGSGPSGNPLTILRGPKGTTTLKPGPFAKESIPGHMGKPTLAEQQQVNALMQKNGCHTCGTKNPGTKSGNAIVDHQPPQALGETDQFLPHCIDCMRRQGGETLQELIKRANK